MRTDLATAALFTEGDPDTADRIVALYVALTDVRPADRSNHEFVYLHTAHGFWGCISEPASGLAVAAHRFDGDNDEVDQYLWDYGFRRASTAAEPVDVPAGALPLVPAHGAA